MMSDARLRPLQMADYDAILALWRATDGVGLSTADERDAIARYLQRNPEFSFVACDGDQIIGAILCGHDGRRGFIHHLAVAPSHRAQGIGRALVECCLAGLRRESIDKCHIFVYAHNHDAIAFWQAVGWGQRHDLVIMSRLA